MLFQPLAKGEIETVSDHKYEYTRALLISGNVAILV